MRSRARYSRRDAATPKPPAIEGRSWEIFTAYCREQQTFEDIGTSFHLSTDQVRRIVDEVSAQLGPVRGGAPKPVALESPLEELGLSVRTRNALLGVGCNTVEDALRLDLSSTVRGLGRKTRGELLTVLERAGFVHPSVEKQPVFEIQGLERSLERMQSRIDRALGIVAKEIGLIKQRLHKSMKVRRPKSEETDATPSAPHGANDYCPDEK